MSQNNKPNIISMLKSSFCLTAFVVLSTRYVGNNAHTKYIHAVSTGDYELLNKLIENGADPNSIIRDEHCGKVLVEKETHIALLELRNQHDGFFQEYCHFFPILILLMESNS